MTTEHDLRRAFDLASLERAAKALLTPDEWRAYRKIEEIHDGRKRYEQRAYELEYDSRVEAARKRLIDEAAGKAKKYNLRWAGVDHFDKDAINRQARRAVQQAHHRRLAAIDNKKAEELRRLIEGCERRRELGKRFQQVFSQATDRRSGLDRRHEAGALKPSIRPRKLTRRREP